MLNDSPNSFFFVPFAPLVWALFSLLITAVWLLHCVLPPVVLGLSSTCLIVFVVMIEVYLARSLFSVRALQLTGNAGWQVVCADTTEDVVKVTGVVTRPLLWLRLALASGECRTVAMVCGPRQVVALASLRFWLLHQPRASCSHHEQDIVTVVTT